MRSHVRWLLIPFFVFSILSPRQPTGSQPARWDAPHRLTHSDQGASDYLRSAHPTGDEARLENLAEFSSTGTDTFVLASYSFENAQGRPNWQGWTSIDRTARRAGPFWHVDNLGISGGNQSMWCGVRSTEWSPCAPGYGDDWWQLLRMFGAVPVQGDVTISFLASWDIGPYYDACYVEYTTDGWWDQLAELKGTAQNQTLAYSVPAASHSGTIQFRLRFQSDGALSDDDCTYDSNGAIRIDNVVIVDATGTIHAESFEDELIGDTQTTDGFWVVEGRPAFGDYARLVDTYAVFADCADRRTAAFGFLAYGVPSSCYGIPDTVPHVPQGDPSYPPNVLLNEVRSPAVNLFIDEDGDPVPASATRVILEFSVYRDLDMWNHALLFTYRARGFQGVSPQGEIGWWSPTQWGTGTFRDWYRVRLDITHMLGPQSDHVQVALGAEDISPGCDVFECGGCTTISPLFDNVRILRVVPGGIRWSAARRDVFQDDFPTDGSVTGHVRMDAGGTNEIYWTPRDSSIVTVLDDAHGLGVEPSTGTPAVYVHVRSSGGQVGAVVLGDDTAYLSNDGQWTVGVCSPLGTNRFACDLADDLFDPGDGLTFYFSAVNGVGVRSYFSVRGGATADEAVARANADEAECLPSGRTDILYIDAAPEHRAETFFEDAFRQLGLDPDRIDYPLRYDENTGVSLLPPRAKVSHLKNAYRTIVLSTGDRRAFYAHFTPLVSFLDSTSISDPGLYITGSGTGHLESTALRMRIGLNWMAQDHFVYPLPVSPTVVATPGSIFDHTTLDAFLVTNRDCVTLDGFDVLSPWDTGVVAMRYAGNPAYPATIVNQKPNLAGRTMRSVTDGFQFERIRNLGADGRAAYLDHLEDVLEFLRGEDITPTPIANTSRAANRLDQNYPNPFNPSTRITYAIAERGRVRVELFDVRGRRVRTLVDAVQVPRPGGHSVTWDGVDSSGQRVASGVYFYRIEAPGYSAARKMLVLK